MNSSGTLNIDALVGVAQAAALAVASCVPLTPTSDTPSRRLTSPALEALYASLCAPAGPVAAHTSLSPRGVADRGDASPASTLTSSAYGYAGVGSPSPSDHPAPMSTDLSTTDTQECREIIASCAKLLESLLSGTSNSPSLLSPREQKVILQTLFSHLTVLKDKIADCATFNQYDMAVLFIKALHGVFAKLIKALPAGVDAYAKFICSGFHITSSPSVLPGYKIASLLPLVNEYQAYLLTQASTTPARDESTAASSDDTAKAATHAAVATSFAAAAVSTYSPATGAQGDYTSPHHNTAMADRAIAAAALFALSFSPTP